MIKLAVFDLDKTMLDDASRLPKDFDESVERLKELGVQTAIASARAYFSIADLFQEKIVNLAGNCNNGNTVFMGRKVINFQSWQEEDIRYLLSFLGDDPDLGLVFAGQEYFYADSLTIQRFKAHDRDRMYEKIKDVEQALKDGTELCGCHYVCFWENYPSIGECVREKLEGPLKGVSDEFTLLEAGWGWVAVTKGEAGKGVGVRHLMETLHCKPDETCAFGDSANDSPMFAEVTHSFAMKNADDEVKASAAYITEEDNNHNGALKAAIAIAEKMLCES